ncbi:LysM peptidoglycan-binding domain-containing protein [Hymenobacter cellulosivorans]|uniref:LysM peptidoglycan-binding domain-containing protein n=1 Tax=Hymenobacter cellulosivorans TaxID=2932249 RepID=A0ABY4F7I0_9BACT|nr:LysM peptidoglycan-binding domain-containing protein [Hymenobacter cellulosivorans]UOQ52062.1 LysM peptidoglycan-binding domain-containing protein [Hymenobacter cellulosivorans]
MTRFSLLLATCVFCGFSASAAVRPVALPDSIGVEYRNNKVIIKHRVAPGETLYGLSRRYKVPVDQIVEENPKLEGTLVTGQIVLVPRNRVVMSTAGAAKKTAPAPATPAPAATAGLTTDARGNKVYKVEKGQTLFSIARRFNTTPATITRVNKLPDNAGVRIGQTLIIVPASGAAAAPEPAPVAAAPAPKAAPAAPANRPERAEDTDRDKEKDKEKETAAATTPAPKEEEKVPERASEIVRKVTEGGLAAVIEGGGTDKYLALHKTAPVGTIMQVRNIMNGQSVYVRVIGQLPDTGENSNILVRLSRRAVQKLATPDSRFRVETSYVP